MKKLILLAALAFALIIGIAVFNMSRVPPLADVATTILNDSELEPPPITFAPAPAPEPARETAPAAPPSAPDPDPREQCLDTLYQSPSVPDRLNAARQLAARGTEESFVDLATFIAAAEAEGDESLLHVAQQVADILGKMHGIEITAIATELAYGPSPLVAEAAVNAAIAAEPVAEPHQLGAYAQPDSHEQRELEEALQRFVNQENSPPQPENK